MSQFPLEGGLPAVSKLRRSRSNGLTTLGINQELNAPGLVPLPVEPTRSQRMIEQLTQVLGAGSQTVEAAGQVAGQDASRFNRQAYKIEEEAAKREHLAAEALAKREREIAAADRGQGSLEARSATPELERQILAGDLKPGVGPDGQALTDEQFADQYVASRTEGLSQDYADAFASHAKPQIMEALARRREAAINLATGQNQDLILNGVATDTTPDALARSALALQSNNKKLSPEQAHALVASSAIKNAVDLGSSEALDRAAKYGGDIFAPDVQAARTRLEARAVEKRNRDQAAVMDTFKSRLGTGEPAESVYVDAINAHKKGLIDGSDLLAMRTRFDEEQRARDLEAKKALDKSTLNAWNAKVHNFASAWMEAGDHTGGAGSLPKEDLTVTLPSGKVETLPRQKVVEAVLNDRFAEIDSAVTNPEENLSRKVDYLTKQGGGAVYQPWAASLNGIATQALRADASSANVSPAALQAVDLYDRLQSVKAYGVINDHLTDDDSRNLLRLVDAVKMHGRGGTDGLGIGNAEAIATVVKSAGTHGLQRFTPISLTTDQTVKDAASEALSAFSKAKNLDTVQQLISDKAGMYRALSGVDEATAVTRAGKDALEDIKIIDGQAVFVRGRKVPPNMEEIGKAIKDEFLASNGKASGLSDSDISLYIDPLSGLVTVQTVGGAFPKNAPVFTLADAQTLSDFSSRIHNSDKLVGSIEQGARERVRNNIGREMGMMGGSLWRGPIAETIGSITDRIFKPDNTTANDRAAIDRTILEAIKVPEDASPDLQRVMHRIAAQRKKK